MASAITVLEARSDCPWLVFVHGMSQDHRVFDRQVDAFKDRFRILLIDLPGHGVSAEIRGPYGHAEFADHVLAAMEQFTDGRAVYWGTHTGATVGVLAAIAKPEWFSALILEGGLIAGRNPPVVQRFQEAATAAVREEGLEAGLRVWWERGCWFDEMRADPETRRAEEHRRIVSEFSGRPWIDTIPAPRSVVDIEPLLSGIENPVFAYNGERDHAEFIEAGLWLTQRIPNARHAFVADTGGFPAWEKPDTVNLLAEAFMRENGLMADA